MGAVVSSIMNKLFNFKREAKMLMLGLDAAGKTTMLYKLQLGEHLDTVPTIGFNVESVQYKSLDMTIWDVGGQDKIRPLWRHYYGGTQALIFIVDSTDVDRFELAKEELSHLLEQDELRDAKLLLFANKQDAPGAARPRDVADAMGVTSLRSREWFVQGCSAKNGDGLYEGLDWLHSAMSRTS
eukprot:PLAT7009.3.p1 GENE.PLAT7009.3~~PLAT7009.3.p1  ORF type:complete len:183 (+),score=106.15 PLAT7009.3:532-1080(+)